MDVEIYRIFVLIATGIAYTKWVPQLLRIFKEGSNSYSLTAQALFYPLCPIWLVYGLLINDVPLIAVETVNTTCEGIVLCKILLDKYGVKER